MTPNETSPDQAVEAVALLPCPFCLNNVGVYESEDAVHCNACGCEGPHRDHLLIEPIEAWNTRLPTTTTDRTDLIAELEKRDADWQKSCDGWVKTSSEMGQPMEAGTEALIRRTIYRRAADALQAHASPRELESAALTKRVDTLLEAAKRLDCTVQALSVTSSQGVDLLGEALFKLSDRLRHSRFVEDQDNHRAYEAVVAAFQNLRTALELG